MLLSEDTLSARLNVYRDGFDHPYAGKGLKLFLDNWDTAPWK
jgi:hypothetical protein